MSDTNTPNESRVTRSGEMVTAPIDDYLLSIADSLHRVQLQLNQNKVLSVDGKSYTTYQLPKLEFELKMSIEMDTTEHKDQRSVIKAIPVNPVNTRSSNRSSTKSESVESASIIKGVFVAVPSDLGKPPPKIRTFINHIAQNEFKISAIVQSAVGEFLSGIEVHFNIDKEKSRKWSGITENSTEEEPSDTDSFLTSTSLEDAIITTDENGEASTYLNIDPEEILDSLIVVLVDVLGKTETILIPVDHSTP